MLKEDEDALICDLAETYNIYDYRSLPARTVATLAAGLRSEARIIQKLADVPLSFSEIMQVRLFDEVSWLAWALTNTKKGGKPPKRMLTALMEKKKKDDIVGFDNAEEFEKARAKMLKEIEDG